MHGASLLGAAKILKNHESELKGTVKLLFQSGEESHEGNIKKGLLKDPKPDVAYAAHVFSMWALNHISYGDFPMAAVFVLKSILKVSGKIRFLARTMC